jgi:hypothetical protein
MTAVATQRQQLVSGSTFWLGLSIQVHADTGFRAGLFGNVPKNWPPTGLHRRSGVKEFNGYASAGLS